MPKTITYPDPPTSASLSLAAMSLSTDVHYLDALSSRISIAERELAVIAAERRAEIRALEEERRALEEKVRWARAYVAPVKRIPLELLRAVFLEVFESEENDEHERVRDRGKDGIVRWDATRGKDGVRNSKCCPWVLASVCKSWRRLSLSIPKLWSKVGLLCTSAHRPALHSSTNTFSDPHHNDPKRLSRQHPPLARTLRHTSSSRYRHLPARIFQQLSYSNRRRRTINTPSPPPPPLLVPPTPVGTATYHHDLGAASLDHTYAPTSMGISTAHSST